MQDAKARFSEFLDTCIAEGPQIVTKRGDLARPARGGWRRRAPEVLD